MTGSSKDRQYARFVPREEVSRVTGWEFMEVDEALRQASLRSAAPVIDPELLQRTHDEAFAQGLEQGRREAALEGQQRLDDYVATQGQQAAEHLAHLVQGLNSRFAEIEQHMAQGLLEVACALARQVLRRELRQPADDLVPVVKEALDMLAADARIAVVRLNPGDHEQSLSDLKSAITEDGVRWVPDESVEPGGCVVESAGAMVDGRLPRRWARAIASLGLEEPWEEPQDAAAER